MSIYRARIKVQCELERVEAVGEKKILVSNILFIFAAFVEDNATIVQYDILKIMHRILKSSLNNIFQVYYGSNALHADEIEKDKI